MNAYEEALSRLYDSIKERERGDAGSPRHNLDPLLLDRTIPAASGPDLAIVAGTLVRSYLPYRQINAILTRKQGGCNTFESHGKSRRTTSKTTSARR